MLEEPAAIVATDTMAGSVLDGESLFSQRLCITCHGPGGKMPIGPNYPVLAGLGMTTSGQTAVAPDGKALSGQRLCSTCHGPEGKAPIQSSYPKLAGQNKEYLVQQITDIQSGARNNGLTAVMKPIVENVTAEEIEAIVKYLSNVQK